MSGKFHSAGAVRAARSVSCRGGFILLALLLSGGRISAAPSAFALADGRERVELPPLCRIESRSAAGDTWRMNGRLAGGLETALSDFEKSLGGQDWSWAVVTLRENGEKRTALIRLDKGRSRLLLMIVESGPGRSFFSIGEVREDADKTEGTTP
jgi:hypothetical protein